MHAVIYIPSIDKHVVSSFLIDTGADMTTIHPQDSLRLFTAAQIRALPNPIGVDGAGAGKAHYPLAAEIIFKHDHGELQRVATTVYLSDPSHNVQFESLLGRDVLGSFIMNFDQAGQLVTFGG